MQARAQRRCPQVAQRFGFAAFRPGQRESIEALFAQRRLLCIQPGSGDSLQFMKAGVMELPDIVVVTKADMGADEQVAYRNSLGSTKAEIEKQVTAYFQAGNFPTAAIAGRAPRNPDACTMYGTCEYFDVCANGVDPEKSTMFRRLETAHTELQFAV